MSDAPGPRRPWYDRNYWDAVAAVIAAFIALLALVVSGYTANLQRRQLRAQVWPRLEIGRSQDRHLTVNNVGMGPARVRAVRVTVDKRPVKTWTDVLVALGEEGELKRQHWGNSTLRGRVLPPGQQVQAFTGHDNDAGRALFHRVFVEKASRLDMAICYCSVLEQCWLAGGVEDVDDEREIDTCPIAPGERFAE